MTIKCRVLRAQMKGKKSSLVIVEIPKESFNNFSNSLSHYAPESAAEIN